VVVIEKINYWEYRCSHIYLNRYSERGNLEIQLFNIQMKLQAAKQRIWFPPEGKLIADINKVICYCLGYVR